MVVLGGELDFVNAHELRELLAGVADDCDLHLDLGEVEFLDCAALGVIIEAATRASSAGHEVTLYRPSPVVRRMIEISGLGEIADVLA